MKLELMQSRAMQVYLLKQFKFHFKVCGVILGWEKN